MSTDYSHFTQLAFDRLFGYGPDGQETLLINSSGVYVGPTSGAGATSALSVASITTTSFGSFRGIIIGSAANTVTHVNSISTTSTLSIKGPFSVQGDGTNTGFNVDAVNKTTIGRVAASQTLLVQGPALQLSDASKQFRVVSGTDDGYVQYQGGATTNTGGMARFYGGTHATLPNRIEFFSSSATKVATFGPGTAVTVVGAISASNLSGTNTGDNVNASSSTSGLVSTGTQSFAGTKTFVTPLLGTNVASASSSASGVVSTGAQSIAGSKNFKTQTFITGVSNSNVAFNTYEALTVTPTATSANSVAGVSVGLTVSGLQGGTTQYSGISSYVNRINVGDANEATVIAALRLTTIISPPGGTTYTYSRAAGISVGIITMPQDLGAGTVVTPGINGFEIVESGSAFATRSRDIYIPAITKGTTGNAFISDNDAFTGDYFINYAGTNASVFGGTLTASNLSGTNTGDNSNASTSTAGIISTGTQSFAGAKTFKAAFTVNGNGTTAGLAVNTSNKVTLQASANSQTLVVNGPAVQLVDASKQGRYVGNGNDGYVQYQGAASADAGGLIRCYGSTHATKPSVVEFYNSGALSVTIAANKSTVHNGYVELPNTIGDPGAVTDGVRLGSVDISAGNASLSLRTETAVVTETVISDRTLAVQINGTTYKICLKV